MVHIRTQKTFFPKRENTSLCKDNHQNKHRNKKSSQKAITRTQDMNVPAAF